MKKSVKLTSMATMATVASLSMSSLVFATSPQNPADLNNVTPENPLIVYDETTSEELVPVRSISERYGFDVDWYNNTKVTVLTKDGHEYATQIDSSIYEINHDLVGLGTNAQLINGTTYVPVSFAQAIHNDLGPSEITDGNNGGSGGGYGGGDVDIDNGGGDGGYGGGDTGTEVDNGFDFNNPNIDNGFTIDDNTGFDFENPNIDNGFTINDNANYFENPDIDNGYNVDVNMDYTTLPAEIE